MGSARPVRGAELAVGDPRGRRGFGAVQFLGSSGAAEAGPVPGRSRQCVKAILESSRRTPGPITTSIRFAEGVSHIGLIDRSRGMMGWTAPYGISVPE